MRDLPRHGIVPDAHPGVAGSFPTGALALDVAHDSTGWVREGIGKDPGAMSEENMLGEFLRQVNRSGQRPFEPSRLWLFCSVVLKALRSPARRFMRSSFWAFSFSTEALSASSACCSAIFSSDRCFAVRSASLAVCSSEAT